MHVCACMHSWCLYIYMHTIASVNMRECMCMQLAPYRWTWVFLSLAPAVALLQRLQTLDDGFPALGRRSLGSGRWGVETGATRHTPIHFRKVVAKDCEASLWQQTWQSRSVAASPRYPGQKRTRWARHRLMRMPVYQRSVGHSDVRAIEIGGTVLLVTRVTVMGKRNLHLKNFSAQSWYVWCARWAETDPMFNTGETSSNESTVRSEVVSSCSESIRNMPLTTRI